MRYHGVRRKLNECMIIGIDPIDGGIMYKFSYSEEKNRIYIQVTGALTAQELESYKEELLDIVNRTQPGFTVFADSTKSDISFLENSGKLQVIRDYAATRGFKSVATVLGKEAYELHQQKPFPGIKNVFTDLQEAEKFLDSLK